MQKSIEILNFHHEKENASLKVLVVIDKEKTNEEKLNSYYQKAMDLNLYSKDLEFIDTHEFLEKYHSKDDFYRSLVYSDIILLSLFLDDYEGSFIMDYIDFVDYYEEYPKLFYLVTKLGRNGFKNAGIGAGFFFTVLSNTNLVKAKNIEDVKERREYIHTNGEKEPFFIDYSSIDKSLPYLEREDQEEKLYNKECKREEKLAKKILLIGITKEEGETNLLGIYEPKEIKTVRAFARSLDFIYSHKESPYYCVMILWVDKEGEELTLLRETPWAINHFCNPEPGVFTVEDKVEIQQSLGNLD